MPRRVFGFLRLLLPVIVLSCLAPRAALADDPLAWPQITRTAQPWTRWWWPGSAVDKQNLTDILHQYHDAGLGGVEICPIYGATGSEDRYIQFLSPQWMQALSDTTAVADSLNMGVDMTTGTGWPMGGPHVGVEDASSNALIRHFDVPAGGGLRGKLTGHVQAVCAFSDDGQQLDLTPNLKDGDLDWSAPAGTWHVYVVQQRGPAMKVKRAAPGGEGNVCDPFSAKAMDDYLAAFDLAFGSYKGILPRSQFHDSYEYVGDWTNDMFDQFKSLCGYDLRGYLPALAGDGDADTIARVKCDYRQTLADLHMAYIQRWVQWCHDHNMLAREQAHGAPSNLLDLYASADIPETETYAATGDDHSMPMNKFASSAAHVAGKPLASAESFTWLGEHFQVSLAQVKPIADYEFLCGINHILFHGMCYSPKDVAWPGWLFYASVDFGPSGGLWHDLPALNAYIARCQSILQTGQSSSDVLLYFPVYDFWQNQQGMLLQFPIDAKWMAGSSFEATALTLAARGYSTDYISDAQLATATCNNGTIIVGGNAYRAIVLPKVRFIPPATMTNLLRLAKGGAKIVIQDALPQDVPGMGTLDARRADLQASLAQIPLPPVDPSKPAEGTPVGSGSVWVGNDVSQLLHVAGVEREPMVDQGLRFVRRTRDGGYTYFVVNRSEQPIDGWVTFATPAHSAVILDPMFPDRAGVAAVRQDPAGRPRVYLQLQPGESCFVRTFTDSDLGGPTWPYWQTADEPMDVSGTWTVHFIDGGPALPADFETDTLDSWTKLGDDEAKRFAGTARYSIQFDAPIAAGAAKDWLLDLGRVCDSVRVRVNGQDVGTVFASPFQIHLVSLLHPGKNLLEFDVTNLAANRIADLDRRGVNWKIMQEINFVNRDYQPFDASQWPLRDSGLIGPVRVTPLLPLKPADASK